MILVFWLDTRRKRGSNRTRRRNPTKYHLPRVISAMVKPDPSKPWQGIAASRFTAFDCATGPPTLIRRDYSLEELRYYGAKLPELYIDELSHIRGADDLIVMEGPGSWGTS